MDLGTVSHVATLARLDLEPGQAKRLAAELSRITEYIDALGKVDVRGVEPTLHPLGPRNQWREDETAPSLPRETATGGAPESEQNFFKVPPVIE